MRRSGIKRMRRHLEDAVLRAARYAAARRLSSRPVAREISCAGFDALRQRWWIQWKLEPLANKLRYVWLIERALALNRAAEARPRTFNNGDFHQIILLQFGHLGDMLHTVPMLRALKTAQPNAAITLVTGPWNKEIVSRIPYVSEVRYIAPRWESYVRGQHHLCSSMEKEWSFWIELRRRNPDIVIDTTSGSLPTLFAMLALMPSLGIGPEVFTQDAWAPPVWYRTISYESRTYEARRLLSLLQLLGIDSKNERLEFDVQDSDRANMVQLLADLGVADDGNGVVLAPGAGWPGKMWPMEYFAEVGLRISQTWGWRVLVVGTVGEHKLAARIVRRIGSAAVNLAGRTSVGMLAGLLQKSCLLITNDSGPYHLAAALDIPTVLLFGPGYPSKWVTPRVRQRVLHQDVGCCCYPWHPRAECDYDRACMRVITVDAVWQAVRDLVHECAPKAS